MPTKIDLLDSALPEVTDYTDKESSGTISAQRYAPKAVREWPDFNNELRTFRRNLAVDNSRTDYDLPRLGTRRRVSIFYNEAKIQSAFEYTAGYAIDQLFDDEVRLNLYDQGQIPPPRGGHEINKPDMIAWIDSRPRLAIVSAHLSSH